ncbi:hypothetical protein V6N11_075179 [Hibiscus sabdariffa]|uniref:Uncharacterized protein n=1 Tax=Hibiscus sabdariffa TaxID=183260 RepID=A0ABR2R5R9_9ROSI
MPLSAASTRYSLVKGERIVRSVLTAWLHDERGLTRPSEPTPRNTVRSFQISKLKSCKKNTENPTAMTSSLKGVQKKKPKLVVSNGVFTQFILLCQVLFQGLQREWLIDIFIFALAEAPFLYWEGSAVMPGHLNRSDECLQKITRTSEPALIRHSRNCRWEAITGLVCCVEEVPFLYWEGQFCPAIIAVETAQSLNILSLGR